MGMFGKAMRAIGKGAKAVAPVARIAGKTVGRALPGVGTAIALYEGAKAVAPLVSGSGGGFTGKSKPSFDPSAFPPPPGMPPRTAVPAAPSRFGTVGKAVGAAGAVVAGGAALAGLLPRGPGGSLQFPWNDPSTIQGLGAPFVLDDSAITMKMKAPPGYVIVRDNQGRPYPMAKMIARKLNLWRPAQKPPISVGDWNSLKRSNKVVKTIKRITKTAQKVANFSTKVRVGVAKKGRK